MSQLQVKRQSALVGQDSILSTMQNLQRAESINGHVHKKGVNDHNWAQLLDREAFLEGDLLKCEQEEHAVDSVDCKDRRFQKVAIMNNQHNQPQTNVLHNVDTYNYVFVHNRGMHFQTR